MAHLLYPLAALALSTVVLTSPISASPGRIPDQHTFVASPIQRAYSSGSPWTSLSHDGLSINAPPGNLRRDPRYLTLSTLSPAELDPSTAILHFSPVNRRDWSDVMHRCGDSGGIESCEKHDLLVAQQGVRKGPVCRAAKATIDGRALFDPGAPDCEPLQQLWDHARIRPDSHQTDELLSFTAHLEVQHLPTSLRNGTHENTFWLAHFLTGQRAAWPLSNDLWVGDKKSGNATIERDEGEEERWKSGNASNKIAGLIQDPYLPRATNLKSGDIMNGVNVADARWNLGISLRLPPPPPSNSSRSFLLPVHAPTGGQVISSSLYRRRNAPSSVNDEQGWVISIRDEWSFVWHLFGISPYHQNVYPGQLIPKGYIVGHVSANPLESKRPLDEDPPADPPEKPPGGDGNPLYPYRFRELRIGVARAGRGWKEWRDAYDEGWVWYDPLRFLENDHIEGSQERPPTAFDPPTIFFSRPSPYPPAPPAIFASSSTLSSSDQRPPTISGDVEIIIGIEAFAKTLHLGPGEQGRAGATKLDPLTVSKVEWGVRKVKGGVRSKATLINDCGGLQEEDWRIAFEHDRIPHKWPSASSILNDATQYDDVDPTSDLWNYVVPSFTTGNYAWTRKKYGSQWDWKARYLFYPLTRTILTSNGPLFSSFAPMDALAVAPHGSWNTRLEAPPVPQRGVLLSSSQEGGPGEYVLAVRAYDTWGNRGCAKTRVWLQN